MKNLRDFVRCTGPTADLKNPFVYEILVHPNTGVRLVTGFWGVWIPKNEQGKDFTPPHPPKLG